MEGFQKSIYLLYMVYLCFKKSALIIFSAVGFYIISNTTINQRLKLKFPLPALGSKYSVTNIRLVIVFSINSTHFSAVCGWGVKLI